MRVREITGSPMGGKTELSPLGEANLHLDGRRPTPPFGQIDSAGSFYRENLINRYRYEPAYEQY
jgi:hypothetical protein